jgi:hypothetical protein
MTLGLKTGFILTALGLLLVANFIMLIYSPYGPEGFQSGMNMAGLNKLQKPSMEGFQDGMPVNNPKKLPTKEGFQSYFLQNAAGSSDQYNAMGPYDNVALPTGNKVSQWRYTAPNERLNGPTFTPGPDQLFLFKNNQCKPECCGSSFSCSGGCVCTTPEQRQYIASRGGNRTQPEDSA